MDVSQDIDPISVHEDTSTLKEDTENNFLNSENKVDDSILNNQNEVDVPGKENEFFNNDTYLQDQEQLREAISETKEILKSLKEQKLQENQQNINNDSTVEMQYNTQGDLIIIGDIIKSKTPVNENAFKKYSLDDLTDFNIFIKEMKDIHSFIYSIILCLFDVIPMANLIEMGNSLQVLLPILYIEDSEEGKKRNFISHTEALMQINAEFVNITFNTKHNTAHLGHIKYQCVRFSEKVNKDGVFGNVWDSFPEFRNIIISWIIQQTKSNDSLIFFQIVNGLEKLILHDFGYGVQQVIPKIKYNVALSHQVFLRIHKNCEYAEQIDKLLKSWFKTNDRVYWRIAYKYYFSDELIPINDSIKSLVITNLHGILSALLDKPESNDLLKFCDYLGQLMTQSKELCTVFSEVIYRLVTEINTIKSYNVKRSRLEELALIYCYFTRSSYLFVSKKNYRLALIADLTEEQFENCHSILHIIISNPDLRKHYFRILTLYLDEFDSNKQDYSCLNYFFLYIAFLNSNKFIYDQILLLLKSNIRAGGKTAAKLKDKLVAYYKQHQNDGRSYSK